MDDYETDRERKQELMNILKRFHMPEDLFDKKQERSEDALLKCFIKHSENAYLELKRSNDV